MNIELRPYQKKAENNFYEAIDRGFRRLLAVLSTGTGKTFLACKLIKDYAKKGHSSLVLVDRKVLAQQWKDSLLEIDPTLSVGIEMNTNKASRKHDVVIASLQTLGRKGVKRIKKFKPEDFMLVIADECHKFPTTQGKRVLEYFEVGEDNFNEDKRLLGLTATAKRHDNVSLGSLFDEIIAEYTIDKAIDDGWAVDFEWVPIDLDRDLSKANSSGDFNLKKLSDILNISDLNYKIVKAYKEYFNEGDTFLCYCVDVDHAYTLSELFNEYDIDSAVVEANTSDDEKKQIIQDHKQGNLQGLFNYGVLCLDEQTEILTDNGWVDIDEMSYDHKVANFNPEDETAFFKEPKYIIKRDRNANEKMVSFSSKRMNYRVTEDHRMLCYNSYKKEYEEKYAKDIVDSAPNFQTYGYREKPIKKITFEQPEKITEKSYNRRISSISYSLRNKGGYEFEESKTKAKERLDRRLSLKYKQPHELSLDECKFLGFYLGDGTYNEKNNGGHTLSFSQSTVYDEIIGWFDNVLDTIGIDYIKRNKENKDNKYIKWDLPKGTGFGVQEREGYFKYLPYLDKQNCGWIRGLNKEQIDALLFGLHLSDGSHGNKIPETVQQTRISSTFQHLMNVLHSVLPVFGYRCSLNKVPPRKETHSPQLRMYCTKNGNKYHTSYQNKPQFENEYKNERVWCVTSDTSFIITRRNGNVLITGNTEGYDDTEVKGILMPRLTKSNPLFTQIFGRMLRPSKSAFVDAFDSAEERKKSIARSQKPKAIFIDFCNYSVDNIVTVPKMFGLNPQLNEKKERFYKEVVEPIEQAHKEKQIDKQKVKNLDDIDLLVKNKKHDIKSLKFDESISDYTNRRWIDIGEGSYEIIYGEDNKILIIEKDQISSDLIEKTQYDLLEYDIKQETTKKLQTFNSIASAFKIADEYATEQGYETKYRELAPWMQQPPTEKQYNFLLSLYTYRKNSENPYCEFEKLDERYENGLRKLKYKKTDEIVENSAMVSDLIGDKLNN